MLSRFLYILSALLNFTYRYRFNDPGYLSGLNGRYILAIWHQNLFAGILAQTGTRHAVIVSKSKDAEPVAFLCEKLGHLVIRGSSRGANGNDKGGKAALDEMILSLSSGTPGAITVDGPKGPAKKVKKGVIIAAKEASVPILPYHIVAKNYWTFNSWDKFQLPKPFSIIEVAYGKPINSQDESVEKIQENLEKSLQTFHSSKTKIIL